MNDTPTALLILSGFVSAMFVVWAVRAAIVWRGLRGDRLVTCPETHAPAAVALDASAAFASFNHPVLRLASCSRWPSRRSCGQECVPQVEAAPDDSKVRTIARQWFGEKTCVYCRQPIADARFVHHDPALLGKDGRTVEWSAVQPENLPTLFRTHLPVCWNCHVAETFRRMYPDLVTDRPASQRRSA